MAGDGSTTVKPGESVEIGTDPATTITNDGEKITITTGGTTTTVTPANEVEVGGDGTVTVPGGSTVKTGDDGPEVKLPQGGTIGGNGEIIIPGGGTVQVGNNPATTITVPEGGGTIQPKPGGTVDVPGGSTVQTGENGPEITVGPGNSGTVGGNGEITVPGGGTVQTGKDPAATITPPTGGEVKPNPDGTVTVPDGTIVKPGDGGPEVTVGPGNGGTIDGDGGVTVEGGGKVTVDDTTITLPSGGGTVRPDPDGSITLPGGSVVTSPGGKDPITIPECGGSVNPETGGITLHLYTVTFDSQGGSSVASATVTEGETVSQPADPVRSGYSFGGWFTDNGFTNAWVFAAGIVTEDMTLYAKWIKDEEPPAPVTHTVTFDSQGGSSVASVTVTEGEKISQPAAPTRSGYSFGGWFTDSSCINAWDFAAGTVTQNVTLYAKWTVNSSSGGSSGGGSSGGGGSTGGGTAATPTQKPTIEDSGGGNTSVTPVRPGETATIRPKPEQGYEVDKITVTDKNGNPVEVTAKPNGTYTFKQPNGKVKIEVIYKAIETLWNNFFTDVSKDDWYYDAVRFVQERGLMDGYSNGLFGPNDPLSRAQLAQILFNKEGRPVVNYLMNFSDVDGGAWYGEAIRWAASQGIVDGYGNGTFGPNDPITREQLAVMLWRYSGSPAATNKELFFNDGSEISDFALEALRWAVENGIINGYGDGRLGPQGQATRAQVAQMLMNFLER